MSLYLRERSTEKQFEIKKEVMKIGRSRDAEISLMLPSVSRHHATLYLQNNGLIVEDAGSQNGVRVNKKPISVATSLKLHDVIELGGVELEVCDSNMPNAQSSMHMEIPSLQMNVNQSGGQDRFHGFVSSINKIKTSRGEKSNRTMLLLVVGAAVVAGLVFMPNNKESRGPSSIENSSAPLSKDQITKALNSESYGKERHVPKTPTEIEAESRYRQAMRDYYDGNYSRAIVILKQALVANPGHAEAAEYLQFAERRLDNQIDSLLKSGQRSYSVMQYARARSEFSQVLSILSEQIPGYWQRVSSTLNEPDADRRPAQTEVLVQIPCEKTKRKEACTLSVEMIKLCRKLLGEEDVLK